MKIATLRGNGLLNNKIFDLDSKENRDNCFEPYVLLRNEFLKVGIILNTADLNSGVNVDFELHQDIQHQATCALNYLLMFETSYIIPENQNIYKKYQRIFTWRDDLVDGDKFIKFNFPNPISVSFENGWDNRPQFCALIAGNKTLSISDEKILYPERVKTIRWFEENASNDFFLYGIGWNFPVPKTGIIGRVLTRLNKGFYSKMGIKPFPSYQGGIAHKKEVLERTKFLICYENIAEQPGYITEKIFDAFFSGCVPVYWGASNILQYIPQECFIDRKRFKDTKDLYRYLKGISETEYINYQKNIRKFLLSDRAYQFSSNFFAETIVNHIKNDLSN